MGKLFPGVDWESDGGGERERGREECGPAAEKDSGEAAGAGERPPGDFLPVKARETPALTTLNPQVYAHVCRTTTASTLGLIQAVSCLLSCEHLRNFAINISQFAKEEMRHREVS